MSLQIATHSLSNVGHHPIQAYQNYNYAPVNSKLDPITEQIINTQDSALEVMKLIENGAAKRMWETQKKMPSVTWVGNFIDRLFGWGKYYRSTEKIDTSRDLLENEELSEEPCTYDPHRGPAIARFNITASLGVQKFPNSSCSFIDPIDYHVKVTSFFPYPPDYIVCKVVDCVRERFNLCQPACLPCINATDQERIDTLNNTHDYALFASKIDTGKLWLLNVYADSNLNAWKTDQIFKLFETTVGECEDLALYKPPDLGPYLSFFLPPTLVLGGIGLYILYRRKKTNTEYTSLVETT